MRRRLNKPDRSPEPSPLLRGRIPMAALVQTLAVAEYMNVRHAANALGLNPSGVGARVRTLEQELGVRLFERHPRGVTLTEAGERFVNGIAAGLDQIDDTIRTIGAMARGEFGRLRIGVHALIPNSFLADLLEAYRQRYPGIDIEITEGTARETVSQLRAGRLDLGFISGVLDIPDCHSRRLWSERLLAALPTGHALAGVAGVVWADLANEQFLVRDSGNGPQVYDHIAMRFRGRLPTPIIRRVHVERATLLSMVAQGYGVSILGDAAPQMAVPGLILVPIVDEPEPVAFSAVWLPHNRSPTLRQMLHLAAKMARSPRLV